MRPPTVEAYRAAHADLVRHRHAVLGHLLRGGCACLYGSASWGHSAGTAVTGCGVVFLSPGPTPVSISGWRPQLVPHPSMRRATRVASLGSATIPERTSSRHGGWHRPPPHPQGADSRPPFRRGPGHDPDGLEAKTLGELARSSGLPAHVSRAQGLAAGPSSNRGELGWLRRSRTLSAMYTAPATRNPTK